MNRIVELKEKYLKTKFVEINAKRSKQWPVPTEDLAIYIDHTILKADASDEAVTKVCAEAEEHKFRSVCVNPVNAALAKTNLPNVDLCCVVGFPLGQNSTEITVAEAKKAIADGAVEIDMVINNGWMKSQKYADVEADITAVAEACHQNGAILKVIIETCLLTGDEKIIACILSMNANADFVKTSTGFNTGGATVEDIALMRETVGENLGVKASGGVRDRAAAIAMLKAGANRIGASAGIKIIQK